MFIQNVSARSMPIAFISEGRAVCHFCWTFSFLFINIKIVDFPNNCIPINIVDNNNKNNVEHGNINEG